MDKSQHRFISVVYQLYTVADGKKTLEEQTGDEHPFEFITGFGVALDQFEERVMGMEKGAEFDFTLQPSEAFGEFDPEGVHQLGREVFTVNGHFDHENIFEGAVITLQDDEEHHFMAKVLKIEENSVTIDTNHPLAGKVLNFTGKMVENRETTEEEVQALIQHLTGGCGHHHGDGEGCGCGHHHGEGCGCGHHHGEGEGCGCDHEHGEHHHGHGGGCGHCHH